ncbi:hypothetical protein MLD38_022819 [Melastoma candidum]|uniref:Uncharacterized protein n=1 Tax=Melastoma candidum TaxID=119954 RepID=A0ACB9QKK8_9MYRT|nr:hypothetical protein MLD38_022819 [Melastoma candidum]
MTSLLPQGPAWWVRRQEKPSLGGQPNLGLKGEGFAGSERVSSPGQPIAAGEDRNPSWLLVEPELGRGSREVGCPLRHRRGRAVEVRGCHGGLRKENESGRVAVEKERREAGSLARLELYRVCRGGVAIAGSEDAGRKAHCGRKRGAAVGRDGARRRWGAAGESDLTTPGSGLAVIRSQNVCEAVGSASGSGAAGCAGEQVAAVRKCQRGGVAGAAVKLLEGWKNLKRKLSVGRVPGRELTIVGRSAGENQGTSGSSSGRFSGLRRLEMVAAAGLARRADSSEDRLLLKIRDDGRIAWVCHWESEKRQPLSKLAHCYRRLVQGCKRRRIPSWLERSHHIQQDLSWSGGPFGIGCPFTLIRDSLVKKWLKDWDSAETLQSLELGGVTSSSSRPEVLGWALPTLKALTSGWAGSSCLGLPLYDHFRPVILLFWVSVGCDGWLSTNCCCCCCNWEICFPPSAIAGVATASEGVLSEGQSLLWRPIPASFHLSHCHHRQTVSADGSANASKMSVSR